MARTPSTMLPLGTKAPDFSLVNVDGRMVSLADFKGAPALLVDLHVQSLSVRKTSGRPARSVCARIHAEEGGRRRHQLERRRQLPGRLARANGARSGRPRLHVSLPVRRNARSGQSVSRCLHARFLSVRPRPTSSSTADNSIAAARTTAFPSPAADLRAAIDAVLAGKKPSEKQMPSIGCNIKWSGNEPDYFG